MLAIVVFGGSGSYSRPMILSGGWNALASFSNRDCDKTRTMEAEFDALCGIWNDLWMMLFHFVLGDRGDP